jgi:hypothetical protein
LYELEEKRKEPFHPIQLYPIINDRNIFQIKICGGSLQLILLTCVQLDVWAKEREVAGLKASLNTLMSEIQRLNTLCAERKEAEDSLKKKWKKIEEFDARRSELESIYTALLKANTVWIHYFTIFCICGM